MNLYERLQRYFPPITLNLIIINLLVWLSEIVLQRMGLSLTTIFGLHYFASENFTIYQLLTYSFLHSETSFTHVFFNMFSLFMFGATIERTLGKWRFLYFYILCAIVAGITQQICWFYDLRAIVNSGAEIVVLENARMYINDFLNSLLTIGASGSVFGILLAFGMLYPKAPIYMFFIPIPIPAKYFVIFYGLIELFTGIVGTNDGIAHFAHLGGMIAAFILIYFWKKKGYIK